MASEFDAENYTRASNHQQGWGQRLIDELALTGSERILDLGCGDGRLTAVLAGLVPQGCVLGIDASRNMIEQARHSHVAANLEFRLLDINEMDFDGLFDLIFSNATLHWIKDHGRLLAHVHRALAHGGVVRFNFAGQGNCADFIEVIRRTMEEESFAAYFQDFKWPWFMPGAAEYEGLLATSGFVAAKVWHEDAATVFQTADALIGWIDQPSLVPFMTCIVGPDRQRFRDAIVARMLERTRQSDGTFLETFRRINVRAMKARGEST
jgi:trans-aconitate 2-methyltransferase